MYFIVNRPCACAFVYKATLYDVVSYYFCIFSTNKSVKNISEKSCGFHCYKVLSGGGCGRRRCPRIGRHGYKYSPSTRLRWAQEESTFHGLKNLKAGQASILSGFRNNAPKIRPSVSGQFDKNLNFAPTICCTNGQFRICIISLDPYRKLGWILILIK